MFTSHDFVDHVIYVFKCERDPPDLWNMKSIWYDLRQGFNQSAKLEIKGTYFDEMLIIPNHYVATKKIFKQISEAPLLCKITNIPHNTIHIQ